MCSDYRTPSISGRSSSEITARASELLPGGVSSPMRGIITPPVVFAKAQGARVWDAEGKEYIDFHAAFGPILIGHNDPGVDGRAREISAGTNLTGIGSSLLEVQLAEKLQEHYPSMEKMLFCNTGSDATYHAMRLARAVTGRPLVVKFQGGYHGWHDYLGANVISRPDRVGSIDSTSEGTLPQALEYLRVLPFNDVGAFLQLMADEGDQVAAVILEPVIHTIGCVPATPDFLATLREVTEQTGTVLVFDEVVTGFRHHIGGYQAIAGIRPDLTTLAKSIGNGAILAVLGGRADLMDHFTTHPDGRVMFGGTFNGHPHTLGAALATIEALEADGGAIHKHLYRLGARMRDGLESITRDAGFQTQAVNVGSVFVCYFTDRPVMSFDDALRNDAGLYVQFHRKMIDKGFLMMPLNLKRNHLMAAHTDADIDRALDAANDVISDMARTAVDNTVSVGSP
jgi:glutamate-1-semialdehyde 2,1-aminomutase